MSVEEEINSEMIDVNTEKDVVEVVKLLTHLDEDLPLKTQIDNPMLMSVIDTLTDNLIIDKDKKQYKLPKTYQTLNSFRVWYRINMVSDKRKGRLEVIEALRTLRDYVQSRMDKALGKNKNEN